MFTLFTSYIKTRIQNNVLSAFSLYTPPPSWPVNNRTVLQRSLETHKITTSTCIQLSKLLNRCLNFTCNSPIPSLPFRLDLHFHKHLTS